MNVTRINHHITGINEHVLAIEHFIRTVKERVQVIGNYFPLEITHTGLLSRWSITSFSG